MPRLMIGVNPSGEPERGDVTRSRIDIFSVHANGRASRNTKSPGIGLSRHHNRFDVSIDLEEGDQLSESRDREWSVLSARTDENGGHAPPPQER